MRLKLEGVYLLLLAVFSIVTGSVNIIVGQPLYVEFGSNLTLLCVSDEGRELQWSQETENTGFNKVLINPVTGGNYITRYTIEKPSLIVESRLVKVGINLADRGVYECHDPSREKSFGLWANVLYIAKTDVTADPFAPVYLYCKIEGFDTNLPFISYHWYYEEETIIISHNYDIVYHDGTLQLTINKPIREDGGNYTCEFTLQTNAGPVSFSKNVYLDTARLESTTSSFHRNIWCGFSIIFFLVISLLC